MYERTKPIIEKFRLSLPVFPSCWAACEYKCIFSDVQVKYCFWIKCLSLMTSFSCLHDPSLFPSHHPPSTLFAPFYWSEVAELRFKNPFSSPHTVNEGQPFQMCVIDSLTISWLFGMHESCLKHPFGVLQSTCPPSGESSPPVHKLVPADETQSCKGQTSTWV